MSEKNKTVTMYNFIQMNKTYIAIFYYYTVLNYYVFLLFLLDIFNSFKLYFYIYILN